jgi:RimJ/RimL family protein N-acetyltransferase
VGDPPYRIVTERLVLRCWEPRDAPLVKAAVDSSLEHLRPWMPWAHDDPVPLGAMAQRLRGFRARFDSGEEFIYGVLPRDERESLGGSGLHRLGGRHHSPGFPDGTRAGEDALEIGYWIRADHLRRGLATEVASALTRVAFDLCAVERVEIQVDPTNTASLAVPRRLGFVEEATLRRRLARRPAGTPRADVTIFSLLEEEFRASPLAAFPLEAYDALGERVL